MSDPTTTKAKVDQRPDLVEAPAANLAAREVEIRIDRSQLRIGDLRFMTRLRRMQLAGLRGDPIPVDAITDAELYAFWDRVIIGGSDAIAELPLAAVADVWDAIDAAISGRAGRPHAKN